MSIDTYEDTDNNLDSDIADFEIAGSSANKKAITKAKKNQYHVKEKLNSINEKRSLDRQLNSFSDYWEF
jgi:uncharacterized protein YdcH (DUF465 family)